MENNPYILAGAILACVSLAFSAFTIFLHFWIAEMMRHPGKLVLVQCVAQLVYDFHWLTALSSFHEYFLRSFLVRYDICRYLGVLNVFSYFLGWNYGTCLSIEILFKLSKRTNTSYKKRMRAYHCISVTAAIVIGLLIFWVGAYGTTDLNTCFIQNRSKGQLAEFLPLMINFPVIMTTLIVSLRKVDENFEPVIINIILVSGTLGVTLALATIISLLGALKVLTEGYTDAGVTIGALSGFAVGLSRLINKKLYLELRRKLGKKNRLSIADDTLMSPESRGEKYTIIDQSVIGLYSVFSEVTIKV
jgi:hypothetical protein